MSEEDDEVRITLRMSRRLRDRLNDSAAANSRSMNGEIVYRLEQALLQPTIAPDLQAELRVAAKENDRSVEAELDSRLTESFSGRFQSLDREFQRTPQRLASMERSLERLLAQVGDLRIRNEQIASDPNRMAPDMVARRAGYDAFFKNPEGPFENPYPVEAEAYRRAYEDGYRAIVLRKIKLGDSHLIERYSDLLGDRVDELRKLFDN